MAIVAYRGEVPRAEQDQLVSSHLTPLLIFSSHGNKYYNGKEQDQRPTSLLIICGKYWKGEEPGDSIELEHILTKSRTMSTCAQLTLVNFSHPFYW